MTDPFKALADLLVFSLLGLDASASSVKALHFFIEDTVKIFALLIIIIFVMGFFRSLLAPERVRELIRGKSRGTAYGMAVGLGAVTPFCSCSSIPLFIGFLEAGLPLGVTMAFLTASPMINEVAVVVLASVVGWKIAALYVVTGLTVGVLAGILTDRFKLERYVEDYVWDIRMGKAELPAPDTTFKGRLRYAWGQVTEIVGRLWTYILLGVGIGALLHGFVPQSFFAEYASADNPLAVPLAVLMGIPLYSNATGVIPVAEALLAKAVPIGTVLALMMAVAAISLPEMIILRKVLKIQMIGIFAGFLTLAFIGVGYFFNALM